MQQLFAQDSPTSGCQWRKQPPDMFIMISSNGQWKKGGPQLGNRVWVSSPLLNTEQRVIKYCTGPQIRIHFCSFQVMKNGWLECRDVQSFYWSSSQKQDARELAQYRLDSVGIQ